MRTLRWFTLLLCVASAPGLPVQNIAVLTDHLYNHGGRDTRRPRHGVDP